MKKWKIFMLATALVMGLAACSSDPEVMPTPEPAPDAPVLTLGATELTLESDGTEQSIGYQVDNPVEGVSIDAEWDAEWLNVNTTKPRMIEFSADSNETGEVRTAEVTVSYEGAESVKVTVSQLSYVSPITLTISSVGATDITFSVETTDPKLTWMPMVINKEFFDMFENDEELFQDDLAYFEEYAAYYEVTLEEWLTEQLATGSMSDIYFDYLEPETEYVLYTYGLTPDGRRTTEIVSLPFTTTAPHQGDLTFTFEAYESNFTLEWTVTPSHTAVPYFCGVVSEPELNEWMATYETTDMREAIQQGAVNAKIEELMDWGMIESASDFFDIYSETGVMDWGWEKLAAETKYYLYAAKWNEECQLVGELATYEHTSAGIEPSENQITLTIGTITQSSVKLSATTTTEDPYVVIPVTKSVVAGLSDDEIFTLLYEEYDYLLDEYTYYGDNSRNYTHLRPQTEYLALAFGYLGGTMTTQMWKAEFTTLASGNPADCTFEISVEPDVDYAEVEIIPSDKGHFYNWLVYPAYYTADDAKNYIKLLIEEAYEGNYAAFASWELSQGDEYYTAWDLLPNTEYKVGVIIMDYDTGEFLNEMYFGEVFKTKEVTYADVTITMQHGPYYDLEDMIAAGYTDLEAYLEDGDAVFPVAIELQGNYVEYYYDIYGNDLSDTETYPDAIFYEGLWYGAYEPTANFIVSYDKPYTLVAVAYDEDYNASHLYREVLSFSNEGCTPASEFGAAAPAKLTKGKTPAAKMPTIKREQSCDAVLNSNLFVDKRAQALQKITENRKAEALKEINSLKAAHAKSASGRMIAK